MKWEKERVIVWKEKGEKGENGERWRGGDKETLEEKRRH